MGKMYFSGEFYGEFYLIFRELWKIFPRNTADTCSRFFGFFWLYLLVGCLFLLISIYVIRVGTQFEINTSATYDEFSQKNTKKVTASVTVWVGVDEQSCGDADLYTSEYCTTFKIWEKRFTYNRTKYYMTNRI